MPGAQFSDHAFNPKLRPWRGMERPPLMRSIRDRPYPSIIPALDSAESNQL